MVYITDVIRFRNLLLQSPLMFDQKKKRIKKLIDLKMIDIEIMLGTVIIIITVPTFNVSNISFYLIRHKFVT